MWPSETGDVVRGDDLAPRLDSPGPSTCRADGGRKCPHRGRPAALPGRRTAAAIETSRRSRPAARRGPVRALRHWRQTDPDLSWVCGGAGRMIRSQTVFEEVVKTVCTTNCSWNLTERMVGGLVEHLGEPAAGAPADGAEGRAFPTPKAMAEPDETFYREVVRAGYRAPYFMALAASVASRRGRPRGMGSRQRRRASRRRTVRTADRPARASVPTRRRTS